MKIYIVTSGEYSDYGIEAVFTSKAKADKYVKINNVIDYASSFQVGTYETSNVKSMQYVSAYYHLGCNEGIGFQDITEMFEPYVEYETFYCCVKFNPNKAVMEKSVYDKYAMYKAGEAGI